MTPPAAAPSASAEAAPRDVRRRRALPVLFLVVFLDLVGFGIVIPLLPFYAEHFGASPFLVGLLMASYSAMQFVFAPLWGRLSDRIGRRPVILASVAGSVVALTAFALATTFWWLLAARMLAGVMAANVSAAQAYVADVTTRTDRARGMGVIGAAFGLGFIFGPAIGGFFGQWGFAVPAFVAAGLAAVNLLLAALFLRESRTPGAAPAARPSVLDLLRLARLRATRRKPDPSLRRIESLARRPVLAGMLALGFVMTVAFAMLESTFGLWSGRAHGFDQVETGYFFAFIGVVIALTQGVLVGPLARRFGERGTLLAGLGGMALALAALPFALSLPALFFVMGLLAFSNGLANPSVLALLSLHAGADEQGGALGLAQSLSALGRVAGPLWGGFAFGALGIGWPFWSGALGMLLALAVAGLVLARAGGAGRRGQAAPAGE